MPTEDDSVTSISIEETNELRKKLGLKPLITSNVKSDPEPQTLGQDTEDVVERLNNVKRRRARESLIKGGGIADSIKKGESISNKGKKYIDGSQDVDTLDLLSWAKKMGKVNKSTIEKSENTVTYSDDEEDYDSKYNKNEQESSDKSKIKVVHKMNELDLVKGDGVTLTLKDVGVLEAESAGISDMDFLENAELVDMKKDKKKMEQRLRNQYGNYVPFEEEEDPLNPGFLKHYDDKIEENQNLKLTKLANEGFFIKLNSSNSNNKTFDTNDEEDVTYDSLFKNKNMNKKTELVDESDIFSVLRSKKDKLKKPKRMNWDKIFTKDDEQELDLTNFVPSKLQKQLKNEEDELDEVLFNQISKNKRRLNLNVKNELDTSNVTSKRDSIDLNGQVDFDVTNPDKQVEITATTEFCKVVKTPMEKIMEQESEPKYKIDTSNQELKDEDPNTLSDISLGNGISDVLSFIKKRGDYIDKKSQDRSDDVQLNYLDSYGNEMKPKEAFRQLSWVFHGKKPSMNKLERKVRRMERERIARQNPVEGLPTMKALFTHQNKEETTHLILSRNINNS